MRKLAVFMIVTVTVLFAGLEAQAQGSSGGDYIVIFRAGTPQANRAVAAARAGAAVRFNYGLVAAAAVRVPNGGALAVLASDPSVVAVVPDRPVSAIQNPGANVSANAKPGGGGGGQSVPAGVTRVGVPTAASNGDGIGVAVVDTGVDFGHADLAPSATRFSAFGDNCQDQNGHGTHVSGTVAALDNAIDVIGVAPKARVYCVKVLDAAGSGSDATVMAGLDWVGANHASVSPAIRVVNMSLGRPGTLNDNPALRASVQALYNAGVAVVVAAGNDPNLEVKDNVPATYPEVLAVASTTAKDGTNKCRAFSGKIFADTASYFTTDGKLLGGIGVTISAPGADQENINAACFIQSVGILSLRNGGGTTRLSGTSMASPHVAGIVARMIQGGQSGVETIRTSLRSTATLVGTAPRNSPTSSYTFDGEREGVAKAP